MVLTVTDVGCMIVDTNGCVKSVICNSVGLLVTTANDSAWCETTVVRAAPSTFCMTRLTLPTSMTDNSIIHSTTAEPMHDVINSHKLRFLVNCVDRLSQSGSNTLQTVRKECSVCQHGPNSKRSYRKKVGYYPRSWGHAAYRQSLAVLGNSLRAPGRHSHITIHNHCTPRGMIRLRLWPNILDIICYDHWLWQW